MQQLLVQVASEKRNPLENSQATLLSEFKQRHLLASLQRATLHFSARQSAFAGDLINSSKLQKIARSAKANPNLVHHLNAPAVLIEPALSLKDLKQRLLSGLLPVVVKRSKHRSNQLSSDNGPTSYAQQDVPLVEKFKSEAALKSHGMPVKRVPAHKGQGHGSQHQRASSKETVTSYATIKQRPVTNMAYHQQNLSSGGGQGTNSKSTAHQTTISTGVSSSANLKSSKQYQQILQKSMLTYQATDFNPATMKEQPSTDYID